ncbi:MAG: hypothetical protein KDA41_20935 [Planctomycetales bacterium]|nr:hypothetical protein [Planctomycetales bacterium]
MSTTTELAARVRASPSRRLQTTMAALRLSFTWWGVRKSLSAEQKSQAAGAFDAEGDFLSAGKKLIDTRDPLYKAVTSVRNRAGAYFKGVSLPYPEGGVRLVRQDDVGMADVQLTTLQAELDEAVAKLGERFDELKSAARARLGRLYNAADYPSSLVGLFAMAWDFPSVEPPEYLRQLSPGLYQQECARMQARFDEAVQLAEQAFLDEFSNLVSHLTERLSGRDDGKPKIFRDSAVENLHEFFERFRHLNIGSSRQLDDLVQNAQSIVRGVQPQQLRDSASTRQRVATQLSSVQSVLDGLLVDRPRRNILRRVK